MTLRIRIGGTGPGRGSRATARWALLPALAVALCGVTFASPVLVVGGGIGALVGAVVLDGACSVSEDATVWGRRWKRTLRIERWDRVVREDRCEDVPVGAEIISRETRSSAMGRLHGHRRSSSGSSHSTSWCRYRIDEWTEVAPAVSNGDFDERRSWPPAPSAQACPAPYQLGCVREAGREEELILAVFPDESRPERCVVPEVTWDRVEPGQRVTLPYSLVFRRPLCDRLE